jgi:hypothetical protein
MADIILGDMCRKNFGLVFKYESGLRSEYKTFIDTLERQMIATTYGSDISNTLITEEYEIFRTQEEKDSNVVIGMYDELEKALIKFCQMHNVGLSIKRQPDSIIVTVNMLLQFSVDYTD